MHGSWTKIRALSLILPYRGELVRKARGSGLCAEVVYPQAVAAVDHLCHGHSHASTPPDPRSTVRRDLPGERSAPIGADHAKATHGRRPQALPRRVRRLRRRSQPRDPLPGGAAVPSSGGGGDGRLSRVPAGYFERARGRTGRAARAGATRAYSGCSSITAQRSRATSLNVTACRYFSGPRLLGPGAASPTSGGDDIRRSVRPSGTGQPRRPGTVRLGTQRRAWLATDAQGRTVCGRWCGGPTRVAYSDSAGGVGCTYAGDAVRHHRAGLLRRAYRPGLARLPGCHGVRRIRVPLRPGGPGPRPCATQPAGGGGVDRHPRDGGPAAGRSQRPRRGGRRLFVHEAGPVHPVYDPVWIRDSARILGQDPCTIPDLPSDRRGAPPSGRRGVLPSDRSDRRARRSAGRVDGGEALGGPGERHVQGAYARPLRPDLGAGPPRRRTPCPWPGRLVTTWSRPPRSPSQPATSSRRGTGVITPTVPSTSASSARGRLRPPSASPAGGTASSTGSTPVERTAVGSGRSG